MLLEDSHSDAFFFKTSVNGTYEEDSTEVFETLSEAKKHWKRFDIAVVDLHVPIDHQHPRTTDEIWDFAEFMSLEIPVIVYSGEKSPELPSRCGQLGLGFLSKQNTNSFGIKAELERARGQKCFLAKRKLTQALGSSKE